MDTSEPKPDIPIRCTEVNAAGAPCGRCWGHLIEGPCYFGPEHEPARVEFVNREREGAVWEEARQEERAPTVREMAEAHCYGRVAGQGYQNGFEAGVRAERERRGRELSAMAKTHFPLRDYQVRALAEAMAGAPRGILVVPLRVTETLPSEGGEAWVKLRVGDVVVHHQPDWTGRAMISLPGRDMTIQAERLVAISHAVVAVTKERPAHLSACIGKSGLGRAEVASHGSWRGWSSAASAKLGRLGDIIEGAES